MAKKTSVRELFEWERARLDAEWAFLNATREGMNIFRRKPDGTTYKQAMRFGEEIAPILLGQDRRLINGLKESDEARFYRQKAIAESAIRGHLVLPQELLDEDITELTRQTNVASDVDLLENRLTTLEKVRQELRPKKFTENQVIFRDASKVDRYLPITRVGTEYVEYAVDDARRLRVRVLHPDPPESKIGADLVYEIHNCNEETVRVVFLQYKMWDRKYLPHDPRMDRQLDKLMGACCRGQLCLSPGGDHQPRAFRFPHCAAFLRPTDRLQDPNATLISSGLHVPICVVYKSWTTTDRGAKVLPRPKIEPQSVSHAIFEYLFVCSLLGSREIAWEEMEKYYKDWGLLEEDDRIVLHAQEFSA